MVTSIPLDSQYCGLLAINEEIIKQKELSLLRVSCRDLDKRAILDKLGASIGDIRPLPPIHSGLPVSNGLQFLHTSLGLIDDRADVSEHVQGPCGGLIVRVGLGSVLDQLL